MAGVFQDSLTAERQMRLAGKAGIVVGAGQAPGKTVGTGRAAALVLAREGAKVMLADRDLASTQDTAAMIADAGGVAECVRADWTNAADCQAMAAACLKAWGRIDFLQNNVGIGVGDSDPLSLTEEAFDRIITVNLKGCVLSCQAALPVMRDQGAGSIVNISSIAALASATRLTAYKLSKAAINALSQSLAIDNAAHMGRPGTSRTRACSSTPTKRSSSLELCSPSTAANSPASAVSQLGQTPRDLTRTVQTNDRE
jgi:NAD(P)-dependent dehydrogenase (short-subunit alcohol dehydrogenase family)